MVYLEFSIDFKGMKISGAIPHQHLFRRLVLQQQNRNEHINTEATTVCDISNRDMRNVTIFSERLHIAIVFTHP